LKRKEIAMKYKPIIWIFMTGRMKKGLKEIWPETNALLKKAITMSMMHSRLIREHTVAEGAGICDYWTVGDKVAEPK